MAVDTALISLNARLRSVTALSARSLSRRMLDATVRKQRPANLVLDQCSAQQADAARSLFVARYAG